MEWVKIFEIASTVLGPQAFAILIGAGMAWLAIRSAARESKEGKADPPVTEARLVKIETQLDAFGHRLDLLERP